LLVVGFLAACGSSGHHGHDAPPQGDDDAAGDSGPSSPLVHVHVASTTGDGKPDATAIVVFMNELGDVVHDGMVDANGDIAWDLPNGGTVTVLQAYDDTANNRRVDALMTFRGVKGGDTLQGGAPKSPTLLAGATVPMTAHMPADAANATLFFECGSTMNTSALQTLVFYDTCRTQTFDLLALRDSNGQRDYMWQNGVTFDAQGDVVINDTFSPIAHYTAALTNINMNARVGIWSYSLIDSYPLQLELQSLDPPMSTSAMLSLQYPAGGGRGTLLQESEAIGISVVHRHVVMATSSPATIALDAAELPLPALTTSMATTTGVTRNETHAGAPDVRYVSWYGQWGGHSASWLIIEPPDPATSSMLIGLPAAYAADDPLANSPTPVTSLVEYADYDNLANYDAARPWGAAPVDVTKAFLTVDHHAHTTNSR
jgi:hypothetical protein